MERFQVYFCWSHWHFGGFGPGLCPFRLRIPPAVGSLTLWPTAKWGTSRASSLFHPCSRSSPSPSPFSEPWGGGRLPCCLLWSGAERFLHFSAGPTVSQEKKEKLSSIAFIPRNCGQTYPHEPEYIMVSPNWVFYFYISVSESFVLCLRLLWKSWKFSPRLLT